MLLGMSFFSCSPHPFLSFVLSFRLSLRRSRNQIELSRPLQLLNINSQIEIFPPPYFRSYFKNFTLPHAIQYDCAVYLCISFQFFVAVEFVFGTFEPSSSSFVCLICRIRCSCIHIWHNNCYNLQTYITTLGMADRPSRTHRVGLKFRFLSQNFDEKNCF